MRLLSLVLLPLSAVAAQEPEVVRPFDGRTLAGWSGDRRHWSVEDGAITGRSRRDAPLEANTYLVWDGVVGDFELRASYRIVGGNSGILYRAQVVDPSIAAGYQADIEAGPSYSGILYDDGGRGIAATRGERVRFAPNGTREVERFADAVELQEAVRHEAWNDYVVRAVGSRLEHTINGVRMVEVVDDAPEAERGGRLALQLHAGPAMLVQFRDLELVHLGPPPDRTPEWVWPHAEPSQGERARIGTTFELAAKPETARLLCTADDSFVIEINGGEVARGDDWRAPVVADVLEHLAIGENTIVVEARNEGGPAGIALRLDLDDRTIATDAGWSAIGDGEALRGVHSFGAVGADTPPWGDVFAIPEATPADQLRTRSGYRVERIHSARPGEGSWIALGFEPSGAPIVGREGMTLARIVLDGDASARVVPLDGTPHTAMGFCHAFGSLYVQGPGPGGYGLHRYRDADADRDYETHELLASLGKGGEHGAHAVVAGPDGALWLINGNMSPLPPDIAPSSPFVHGEEDVLLPRIEDPRGHAVGVRAPGAHLLRTDPDGTRFELVAAGMRNPYDVAFGPDGEAFTVDADMEWDLGLPWYRAPRVLHVVSGGEFGWRSGSAKWPAGAPDALPSVADLDLASPTGATFGTELDFAAAERRALFVGDWAFGRILAVHLAPEGSSWKGRVETFVSGKPLNVTDLAPGPDGALWFVTGGRGTQSGLYRIVFEGRDPGAMTAHDSHAERARAHRRTLEALHGRTEDAVVDTVWTSLGDPDPFVRHAARVALEHQDPADWWERATTERDPARALTALLALARAGDERQRAAVLGALGAFDWPELSPEQRRSWLRVHTIALARGAAHADLLARLDPLFPAGEPALDRALLELLVHLDHDAVVERALDLADASPPADGIAFLLPLRLTDAGAWSMGDRERFFAALARARTASGGLSFGGYLDRIGDAVLARVPEAERSALAAAGRPRSTPTLTAAPSNAAHDWSLPELLAVADRASGPGRSFENGKAAYVRASCIACHRVGDEGGAIGPDLTASASRFSRRDLLRAIVEPSADVSDQYADVELTTRDGLRFVGRIVAEDVERIELVTDATTGERRTVAPADVVARRIASASPMPAGLLATLDLEAVLDLIAFLESGGDPAADAFRSPR